MDTLFGYSNYLPILDPKLDMYLLIIIIMIFVQEFIIPANGFVKLDWFK